MTTPFRDRCMCLGWQGQFGGHLPYVRELQGVLHSPVGCMRAGGPKTEAEYRTLYFRLTGLRFGGSDFASLWQAVMLHLKLNPAVAATLPVRLTPAPAVPQGTAPHNDKRPPARAKAGVRVVPTPPPPHVPGMVVPPWLRRG